MKVDIVVLGTDINSYYMARCYHELYNKKATLIGHQTVGFTSYSNICNVICYEDLYNKKAFTKRLIAYAKKRRGNKKILLIATSDTYVKLVVQHKKALEKYYTFNYPMIELVDNFTNKDIFYSIYQNSGLIFPKTIIYNCKDNDIPNISFEYPIIIKPGDVLNYFKREFAGKKKIYKIKSEEEYYDTINLIKASGYDSNLIIQEFIPGDDSYLFDSVFYCSSDGQARIASFAQIALQEHTPSAIGNCTVLINGYSQYAGVNETVEKLKTFLESVHYQGFCEVDLKYDYRDQTYKVLEINTRQGRSSYYLSACGYNLIKYLVDDLFKHDNKDFELITTKQVLSFVPKYVIKKYVDNKDLKKEILKTIKEGKICNPLKYNKDKHFKRFFYLLMRSINYIRKYRNNQF